MKKRLQALNNSITVDGKEITIYAQRDPKDLPWGDLDVDVVLECTGFFTSLESASAHIEAGAKKVVISAPAKGDLKTVVFGTNENVLDGSEKLSLLLHVQQLSCTNGRCT